MPHIETPQEHNYHPRYRPDIDGLRALAILPVVAYHAFPAYMPGGFIGVDIFFVISGYLISLIIFRSHSDRNFRLTEFYAHRIKRILPALLVVASACYALGWFALLPDEFKQLGKHIAAGMGFAQNFVLWSEAGYFDVATELKPLMHLWSLAVEEQFYLVYPALIWLAWRGGRSSVFAVVLIVGVTSFSLNATGATHNATATFFSPQTRVWELMAGSLLAYLHEFRAWPTTPMRWLRRALFNGVILRPLHSDEARNAALANIVSILGFLFIFYSIFALDNSIPYPGVYALLPVGGAFLLILAGRHTWVNRHLLANRLMIAIGLISYPLYLWHWPLLSFPHIMETETPSIGIRAAAVALAFLFAALTYWFIEKPVRYGLPTARKIVVLGISTILVGFIGYQTYQHDGLAFRINETKRLNALLAAARAPALPDEDRVRCKQSFLAPEDSHKCWIAKNSAPTIQLIGDSHARALYPGLRIALNGTSENLFHLGGVGGCPPFFDIISYQRNSPEEEHDLCTTLTNYALHVAETSSTIHTVVLVSRGPLYLSGKGFYYGTFSDEENHDRVLQSADQPGLTDHYRIWEVAMRKTLSRLVARGKRVVFILDNPELGFYPSSCIDARPLRLFTRVRQPCAIPYKDFDERNRKYRELVASVLKDYPAVKAFDAAAPLCDKQWCWAMKDGQMLYRDDDHLSLSGAQMMATRLMSLLSR